MDVYQDGKVNVTGRVSAWLSLTGISFPIKTSSDNIDDNTDMVVDKSEFVTYIKSRNTAYSNAHVIIPNDAWSVLDTDGSGNLDESEFSEAEASFNNGHIYGKLWAVHEAEETKHLTQFHLTNYEKKYYQRSGFAGTR